MSSKPSRTEDPAHAARHCLDDIPYRMVAYVRLNGKTPLYCVAGSNLAAMGAEKALREAHRVHGGSCFYCKREIAPTRLTIDHVEPRSDGGGAHLQNLVLAHRKCNVAKGNRPIEAYAPEAGREWLSALLLQVRDRLNRL